jgi:hypothetical protein
MIRRRGLVIVVENLQRSRLQNSKKGSLDFKGREALQKEGQ